MPYIKQEDRKRVGVAVAGIRTAGELNYIITLIIQDYLRQNGNRYQQLNDVIGALESCKLEFYRRIVSPYEDDKINENGDVYGIQFQDMSE
jgi:hypothetical protein